MSGTMGHDMHTIMMRTSIAACNADESRRVYMQDVMGHIRECTYDQGWSESMAKHGIGMAKLGSPIAACCMGRENICVFFLSNENRIIGMLYDRSRGWNEMDMKGCDCQMAPYSSIAACFVEGSDMMIRIYCQMPDNSLQEFGAKRDGTGWKKMENLGSILIGSTITCTSFMMKKMPFIRLYYQDDQMKCAEKCFDDKKGWYTGAMRSSEMMIPRAAMACTSYIMDDDRIGIRVFMVHLHHIVEMIWDGKEWRKGDMEEYCLPGTEMAAICWGHGNNVEMRIYFQKGEFSAEISEAHGSMQGKWRVGKPALPPM